MRKLALSLLSVAMLLPSTAMACHHAKASSINVSCEQGVRVYRGTPLAAPVAPRVIVQPVQRNNNFSAQRAALQSERLAFQSDRIDALESRLDDRTRRRGRRIFSAPVGAFGVAPFVRRRGFNNRRRGGIRVRFDRRIRG